MTVEEALTVVVPTRDRPELLDECLRSLRSALRQHDELIVVDSASRKEAVREIAEQHAVTYIRLEAPGASRARNEGWRIATKSIVAFVDDDVRVEPSWAVALASVFDRYPPLAFVSGRIGSPAGEDLEYPVAEMVDEVPFKIDITTRRTNRGHSANLAVRHDALVAIGGFDVLLGAGGKYRASEDADLIDRLIGRGYVGRYEPAARAVHVGWRDRTEILRVNWCYGIGTGARIAKLLRMDRRRAIEAANRAIWHWGLLDFARRLRARLKFLSVVVVIRMIGMLVGFARALPRRVQNGHFASSKERQ